MEIIKIDFIWNYKVRKQTAYLLQTCGLSSRNNTHQYAKTFLIKKISFDLHV